MKKRLISIATGLCALLCVTGFASCKEEHTHEYKSRITPPTCTEEGFTTYRCDCGDKYIDDEVPATGHDYTTQTVAPTCTTEGFTTYVCDCGDSYIGDEIPATGHAFNTYAPNGDGTQTAACDNGCGWTDTKTMTGENGVSFRSFTLDGNTLSGGRYANAKTTFDFAQEVEVHGTATYFLTTDKTEKTPLPSKVVNLAEGENTYYLVVGNGGTELAVYEVALYRNRTFTVSFEGLSSVQTVEEGRCATMPTTTPTKAEHTFKGWNFDFSTPITGNISIAAIWQSVQVNTYAISVSASEGGSAQASANSVKQGTSVTLTATPDEGYEFTGWYNGANKVSSSSVYTFPVYHNVNYTATFAKKVYKLTVKASGSGTVTGGGNYEHGEQATIVATANSGYEFVGWSDGNTEATRTITMRAAMTLTANFALKKLQITIALSHSGAGTVTGGGAYENGALVTLTVSPNAGYEFIGWYEDGAFKSASTSFKFNASKDRNFVATFQAKETPAENYTVAVAGNMAGAGTFTGAGTYASGAQVTLTATTNTGYTFLGWFNGAQELSKSATYTFTAQSNLSLTAKWQKNTYTVSVSKTAGGTATGAGVYEHGAQATLSATTNAGYKFLGWYDENDGLIDSATSYTFTVNNNRTITAKWEKDETPTQEAEWRNKQGYNYFHYAQLGEDVMPIGSWYAPPPPTTVAVHDYATGNNKTETFSTNQITLKNYQMIADSGINAVYGAMDWVSSRNGSKMQYALDALDYAHQAGIVYLVRDLDAQADLAKDGDAAWEKIISYYATKPAFGGTLFGDEPGYTSFETIGKATAAWRGNERYGESKLSLVNNLPNYASAGQLYYGAGSTQTSVPYDYKTNFEDWVQAYIDLVNPQVYSYDFYPFNGRDASVMPGYYENMSTVRKVCLEANIPFWVFAQAGTWEGPRGLSQAEIAIQINTALAYGAKGYQWFNYWHPLEFGENFLCGLVDKYGNKTKYYDMVKAVNAHTAAVDHVLMKSASKGIVQIGESKMGTIPTEDKLTSYGAMTSATGAGSAIIGCFEYRDQGYAYYISSNDPKAGAAVTLNLDGVYDVQKIQNATTSTLSTNSVTVNVEAGEGVLIVVPKTKSSKATSTITVQTGNAVYGAAFGTGKYGNGTQATVVAYANDGGIFAGWYEGTTKVSSDAAYTFNVSGNRTLTAKWEADKTPVMLNNCDVLAGWMQAANPPALSTSNVFEGNASIEVYSGTDWWWFNLRILEKGITLSELQAKYETITLNVYSSYPGTETNTLFLGNGVKVGARLSQGNNVVTINTADLTDSIYVTDGTGYFINFYVGGACTLRIDNVVAMRK